MGGDVCMGKTRNIALSMAPNGPGLGCCNCGAVIERGDSVRVFFLLRFDLQRAIA